METIKKYAVALVAVAAIAVFSAFNIIKKLDAPQDGWYELQYINPNIQDEEQRNADSNLAIGEMLSEEAPQGDCEQFNVHEVPCAVGLEFSATSTKPATLAAAKVDPSITTEAELAWSEEE